MIYLPNIVDFINVELAKKLVSYPTAEYKGIATSVVITRQNNAIIYPSVIEINGTVNTVTFNYGASFTLYHRLQGSLFSQRANAKVFGQDGQRTVVSTTTAQIVVIGERAALNVKPEQLAMQIADSLPGSLAAPEYTALGIQSVQVYETGIEYDQRAIFNKEFQGVRYFIGPELFMLAVRYIIEGVYLKGCTSLCEC